MLKINRTDADIEHIANCLLHHSECPDITDSRIVEIKEMPERWLHAIWPDASDADIVEEFKEAFYAMEMYELSPIDPEEDPYFLYAKWLRESWLTKKVDQMLREGHVEKEDEEKVCHMLDVIHKGKRRRGRYVLQVVDED
ncbi:MAG: hypothetical protein IJM98_08720 [Oscillospiraceae bacterium]|nr:hypothetical protein [Oscillospiraceae bacterium]